jgi:hypothetical protein
MNSSSIVRIKEREAQCGNLKGCENLNEIQRQPRNRNQDPGEYETSNQNPSGLEEKQNRNHNQYQKREEKQQRYFIWEMRLRQQLLRAEREEAVRRELAVGAGPLDRR